MIDRARRRLSYANVTATLALFVALGGGAYATHTHRMGTDDLRNRAVTAPKLADRSVPPRAIRRNAVRPVKIQTNAIRPRHLLAGAVTTPKLADLAVDTGKLADLSVTTPKLAAGAVDGSKIDPTEVQRRVSGDCPGGEAISAVESDGDVACEPIGGNGDPTGPAGGDLDGNYPDPEIRNGAVTPAKIAAAAVTTQKLDDAAVTSAKLATLAVTANHIADGSVTTDKIADGSIFTPKLADQSVAAPKLTNGSVITEKISVGAVTNSRIADNAINSAKVADGSLTADDLNLATMPFWRLGGNAGTNPAGNFLGTTDNQPLNFRVNDERALRLEPSDHIFGAAANVIGGHPENNVTPGAFGSTISGGGSPGGANRITDEYGTVGGGANNRAGNAAGNAFDRPAATVAGGVQNVASGMWSSIGGGLNNMADGSWATIPGGYLNRAPGDHSFAAGHRAAAQHDGTFVWADSQDSQFNSDGADQFVARAQGGFFLGGSNCFGPCVPDGRFINTSTGAYLSSSGTWTNLSDARRKSDFEEVDGETLLEKLERLAISSWSYDAEPGVRHIGPTAQDFFAAFGLGDDETAISTVDASGVALAAIQALSKRNTKLERRVAALERRLSGP